MRMRLLAASGALAAVALASGPASATESDPLFDAGLAATALGAGAVVAGSFVLETTHGPTLCGVTGCFTTRSYEGRRIGGAVVGAGVGAAALGVPALLAGLGPRPGAGERRSEPRMLTGFVLTDQGMALLGAGIGLMVADKGTWVGTWTGPMAAIFMAGGVTSLAVGIPLWASGQSKAGPRSPVVAAPEPSPPPLPPGSGTGLRAAGISLTAAGVVAAVAGGVSMATADTRGDFGGFNLLPGLIAFGTGNLLMGAGIPMWIVGQNKVSASRALPEATISLRASGAGLSMEGTF